MNLTHEDGVSRFPSTANVPDEKNLLLNSSAKKRRIKIKRRRGKSNKEGEANYKDLVAMVKQNHSMYKQVLQQKITVEEINKSKQILKIDDAHKITKAHTFATSPRFDVLDMTIRY